jgi:hypothetical protein
MVSRPIYESCTIARSRTTDMAEPTGLTHPPVDWTLFFVDAPVGLWDGLMPASIRPIRIAVFNILAIQLALQWPTYSYSLF